MTGDSPVVQKCPTCKSEHKNIRWCVLNQQKIWHESGRCEFCTDLWHDPTPTPQPAALTKANAEKVVDEMYREFVNSHPHWHITKSQRGDFWREIAIRLQIRLDAAAPPTAQREVAPPEVYADFAHMGGKEPAMPQREFSTCGKCQQSIFFHGDSWYHTFGADVMKCGEAYKRLLAKLQEPIR
jgi:hypothetical protein